jgi:hypothetical protein
MQVSFTAEAFRREVRALPFNHDLSLTEDVQMIQKVPSKTDATHLYPSKVSRLAMTEVQKEKIPTLYWTMKLLSTVSSLLAMTKNESFLIT